MRLTLTLVAAVAALAACDMPAETQIASAPVTDPYVTGASGAVCGVGGVFSGTASGGTITSDSGSKV